jgi:hypothetical protein
MVQKAAPFVPMAAAVAAAIPVSALRPFGTFSFVANRDIIICGSEKLLDMRTKAL